MALLKPKIDYFLYRLFLEGRQERYAPFYKEN